MIFLSTPQIKKLWSGPTTIPNIDIATVAHHLGDFLMVEELKSRVDAKTSFDCFWNCGLHEKTCFSKNENFENVKDVPLNSCSSQNAFLPRRPYANPRQIERLSTSRYDFSFTLFCCAPPLPPAASRNNPKVVERSCEWEGGQQQKRVKEKSYLEVERRIFT